MHHFKQDDTEKYFKQNLYSLHSSIQGVLGHSVYTRFVAQYKYSKIIRLLLKLQMLRKIIRDDQN
jgi:hypothetical protein